MMGKLFASSINIKVSIMPVVRIDEFLPSIVHVNYTIDIQAQIRVK